MNLRQQFAYEAEGAAAALQGKKREDCPYNLETQPGEWNHWVYGNDVALGELEIIERGYVEFVDAESGAILERLSLQDALAAARWKPRYAMVP